jgi:hypothetical protein
MEKLTEDNFLLANKYYGEKMKRLFLKIIVLILSLSNLSFDEVKAEVDLAKIKKAFTDLSQTDQILIGVFVSFAVIIGGLLYRYKNQRDFLREFDRVFQTKVLTEREKNELLNQGVSEEQIGELSPKIINVIKDLRKSMGVKDIKINADFINQELIKSIKAHYGEYLVQNIDFAPYLTGERILGGKYYRGAGMWQPVVPEKPITTKKQAQDRIKQALDLGEKNVSNSSDEISIAKSKLIELSKVELTEPAHISLLKDAVSPLVNQLTNAGQEHVDWYNRLQFKTNLTETPRAEISQPFTETSPGKFVLPLPPRDPGHGWKAGMGVVK